MSPLVLHPAERLQWATYASGGGWREDFRLILVEGQWVGANAEAPR